MRYSQFIPNVLKSRLRLECKSIYEQNSTLFLLALCFIEEGGRGGGGKCTRGNITSQT